MDRVIIDIEDDGNGIDIEAIKKIIKRDASANIIVCSTLADRQKVIEAVKEGAASYILKPPSEEKLISEINNIFGEDFLVKNQKSQELEQVEIRLILGI